MNRLSEQLRLVDHTPPARARLVTARDLDLTPVQNERVRQALRYLMLTRFANNMTRLGAAVGRKQQSLSGILLGNHQASLATARRTADMFGVTLEQLIDSAQPLNELDADASRCPALASVLRRLAGLLPPPVVQQLQSARFGGASALTEEEWLDVAIDLKRSSPSTRSVDDAIAKYNALRRPTP